ncbi:pyrroloquinoline quinone biosynthesis protein PqqF [Pseudomonas cremoricolorata]|uniref:Coenzyme PQQ synthesis protein F n=1 Tax=Pseudomonas cremoricolorata TaxID=157783 RepID=A0A089WIK2_9PSED|nr:pyrroloquinoline quinone biosynthesis protein PqqF [Pseudomonas cremoricolorata]AIR88436.1 peptidase M16 [Pseudomonas cremoricolorata]
MPDATRSLCLANGLHLLLRHSPRLNRAAAALRVRAGSHDAAARWPGLAHFLEHLLFLGTARFPLEDGLMRFVQGAGGHVNASTRERTTDFFFEVPCAAFAGGLERLCQMLAEPLLDSARQQREREVIHAEFIAWSRDAQARGEFALLQAVSPRHPLSGFHAGNRFSLALHDPAFQHALRQFHQRFYCGGQMTLSLCGPQPLDQLEALGRRYAAQLPTGPATAQAPPPALLDGAPLRSTELLFAHEHLPAGAERALQWLAEHITDPRPGSWLHRVQQRQWASACRVRTLYAFAGQALWHVELLGGDASRAAELRTLLYQWFDALRQAPADQLNEHFSRVQKRRADTVGALQLARADSSGLPLNGLDEQAQHALAALLDSLPSAGHAHWPLPAAEALLLDTLPASDGVSLPAAVDVAQSLPCLGHAASFTLRWRLPIAAPAALLQALQPLQARASQASVHLQLDHPGCFLQLQCRGPQAAVIRTVALALEHLRGFSSVTALGEQASAPVTMPIRALLAHLPEALSNQAPAPRTSISDDALWAGAQWHAQANGFDAGGLQALATALRAVPGQPAAGDFARPALSRRWQHVATPGGEHALLLFCPLLPGQQAAGRLLAHLLQGPVYQRLRVELQLGYAVFSAFRQVEGIGGLLFGVQSPHTPAVRILQHLHGILAAAVELTPQAQQALIEQFEQANMDPADIAHWAWQHRLAGTPGSLLALREALGDVCQADLERLQTALLAADAPWLCLANTAEPAPPWPPSNELLPERQ